MASFYQTQETSQPWYLDPGRCNSPFQVCDTQWNNYLDVSFDSDDANVNSDFIGDFPLFSPDITLTDSDPFTRATLPDSIFDSILMHNNNSAYPSPALSKSNHLIASRCLSGKERSRTQANVRLEEWQSTPGLEFCDDSEDYTSLRSESSSPRQSLSYTNLEERWTKVASPAPTRRDIEPISLVNKGDLPLSKDIERSKKLHNAIERKYRGSLNSKFAEIDSWLSKHSPAIDDCEFSFIQFDLESNSNLNVVYEDTPKKRTKGAILTRALSHLQKLESCNKNLEVQNIQYSDQVVKLQQLLLAHQKKLRAMGAS